MVVVAIADPRPHTLLSTHARAIPRAGAVLDIHARDGDDALYLAQRGYAVEAIVADPTRREALARRAAELDVRIDVIGDDPRTFSPLRGQYMAVLGLELWPALAPLDAEALMGRLPSWVGPGGLVLLSAGGDGAVAGGWQPARLLEVFWGFERVGGAGEVPCVPPPELVLRRVR